MKQSELTKACTRYQMGYDYNLRIGYYSTVSENNDYLIGEQWGTVPKDQAIATFNFEKMIQRYKTGAIASQQLTATYLAENVSQVGGTTTEEQVNEIVKLMTGNAEILWEKQKMDSKVRKWIADAWVSGDMCAYSYWDSYIKTGQDYEGDICTKRASGGNVFFGNPNERDVECQPYILILARDTVYNLKKQAKQAGLSKDDIAKIGGDLDTDTQVGKYANIELQGDNEFSKCNSYYMFEKDDNGMVHWSLSTNSVVIRKDTNLNISRYPIAWAVWEDVENSYHGRAESTGIHPAQRFVNKMYSLCMMWMINNSLGKVAFDETMISNWSNDIGSAIPVNGNPNNVIQQLRSGDFNNAILQVIDTAINYTRDFCGVTDAALGQGRADNTSAIVALGKQAAMSLENQQNNLKQFIEDIYLIWAELMLSKYATGRRVPMKEDGKIVYKPFDAKIAKDIIASVKIEVGASSIWSEIAAIQTLDNMLLNQVIDDIQYLERIPNGIITGLTKLIDEKKAMRVSQAEAQKPMTNNDDFEEMASFMETLPKQTQIALKAMPPEQMQQEVINLMNMQEQGGEQNGMQGQGNEEEVDLDAIMRELGGGMNGQG
jgi:hypothetical protein